MKKIVFWLALSSILASNASGRMVDNFMDACEEGSMQGCYQAGVVYWTGEGAGKDRQAAKALLEISCDGGFPDACVALKTFNEEDGSFGSGSKSVQVPVRKSIRYRGHTDGKLQADIDNDGKDETVAWKKFASVDLGDYYQLLVIDNDGSLLWKGPKEKDDENPLVFSSLDFGVSMPQLLTDFDQDGYIELIAPEPQSDVSPTYYRKLRWKGSYFEPLLSNALILSSQNPNQFVWKKSSRSYGTWVSSLAPYSDVLAKAYITHYSAGEHVETGVALIRFNHSGATLYRWIKPMPSTQKHKKPSTRHKTMGLVHGLDPYGDGFLSIRKKPNATEIGRLYNGDRIEILGKKGKWYKIRDTRSGRVGWSHSNWISINY